MQTPVQIVFHEVAHSPVLESLIREKAGKLEEHAQKMRREVKHHANGQPVSDKQNGEQQ